VSRTAVIWLVVIVVIAVIVSIHKRVRRGSGDPWR
jgi:hypothetical protein